MAKTKRVALPHNNERPVTHPSTPSSPPFSRAMASGSSAGSGPKIEILRIPPFSYLHVTDSNTNVTRVVEGPQTFTCMDHEVVVLGPVPMVALPPRHFCIVSNPVVRDGASGAVVFDGHHQAKLRHGDREVRLARDYPDPFALYPGEELTPKTMIPLQVVPENTALRLRATRDFTDRLTEDAPVARCAGEEWLFRGHRTYYPQVEVEILDTLKAVVLGPNQALRLQARNSTVDSTGTARSAGEEWLVLSEGAYLPDVEEIVVGVVDAVVLTNTTALHLRAENDFTDVYGVERKTGDEWLVTKAMREMHIPGVAEHVVSVDDLITLANGEYAVVNDPVDLESGEPDIGAQRLVLGPTSFFLQPGERLDDDVGIGTACVLGEEEALLLTARFNFTDDAGVARRAGDRWLWYGPGSYVPPPAVRILARKRALVHIEGWLNAFFWLTTHSFA
ncbi:major vault protein [Thecamonas trahens ATCC 50062]|uniref:Major vault protein n=1 Tax=Thecamonas trahens ATCC 50062 TaxID=461836 RepID=A0A0L0DNT8_THETB|nr:major vault protein [Thecamonas trahens ATCC 50062]KNC53979.1 major vault protein [Thecamonas trahens ATCC 50062]|eukprot:XP_013754181.1 major vault protein [Thecamonas trahens ATCC 50062]